MKRIFSELWVRLGTAMIAITFIATVTAAQNTAVPLVPMVAQADWRGDFIKDIILDAVKAASPRASMTVDISEIEIHAVCGKQLDVLPGKRSVPLQLELRCTSEAPLIVRSVVPQGAIFEMDNAMVVQGSFITIDDFLFSGNGLIVSGSHHRISNNHFSHPASVAIQLKPVSDQNGIPASYNVISENRIEGFQSRGIEIKLNNDAREVQYNWILKNHLLNTDQNFTGNGREAIRVLTDAYGSTHTLIERNLMENVWVQGEPEAISVKTAGVHVVGNKMKSKHSQLVLRESQGSVIVDNHLVRGDIRVHGRQHVIADNRLNFGDILIPSGDQLFDGPICNHKPVPCLPNGKSAHAAVEEVLVVGNVLQEGSIEIGACIGFDCPDNRDEWPELSLHYPAKVFFKNNSKAEVYVHSVDQ